MAAARSAEQTGYSLVIVRQRPPGFKPALENGTEPTRTHGLDERNDGIG
jgi:hypothetical protein